MGQMMRGAGAVISSLLWLAVSLAHAAEPAPSEALGSHLIGTDYVQVDPATHRHVLFSHFDAVKVTHDLTSIAKLGLNPVRIFVESEAYPTHPGRVLPSDPVAQNLHALLKIAAGLKLNMIVTFENWVPAAYMNMDVKQKLRLDTDPRGVNAFLFDPEIIKAHAESIADLLNATAAVDRNDGAPPGPFAVDLANELSFYVDHDPVVQVAQQAAPGQAGAAPKSDAVRKLVSDAVDAYVSAHKAALRHAGYDGLITVSAYAPGPYPGDTYATGAPGMPPRRPVPLRHLRQTAGVDFIAVNVYPDPHRPEYSADALLDNLDLFDPACRCGSTPVLVTETGLMNAYFAGMGAAPEAQYFRNALRALCKRGVRGWLYWSWSTPGDSLPLTGNPFLPAMIADPASGVRC